MPKGMFTQGVMILTEGPLADDAITRALAPFDLAKRTPREPHPGWMGGHATWVIAMRRQVNGAVIVEMVNAPWPDHMGDPKAPDGTSDPMGDVMLFGAWSMGIMGPHTYPRNLARARQFAELLGQDFVAEAAASHRAFVRIRSSYVMGASPDAKIFPEDYDPRWELDFVTSVAQAIAHVDGALCYFNPGGETLVTPAGLDEMLESCARDGLPPLPVWSNGRLVRLDNVPGAGGADGGWMLADVVGMDQLMAPDHEAVFQRDRFDVNEVIAFLRNAALYTLQQGPVIETGHTTDGPGGHWRALLVDETLMEPPRPAIRWYADTGPKPPPQLLPKPSSRAGDPSGQPTPHRRSLASKFKSMFGR